MSFPHARQNGNDRYNWQPGEFQSSNSETIGTISGDRMNTSTTHFSLVDGGNVDLQSLWRLFDLVFMKPL